jgi:hypothetical protein
VGVAGPPPRTPQSNPKHRLVVSADRVACRTAHWLRHCSRRFRPFVGCCRGAAARETSDNTRSVLFCARTPPFFIVTRQAQAFSPTQQTLPHEQFWSEPQFSVYIVYPRNTTYGTLSLSLSLSLPPSLSLHPHCHARGAQPPPFTNSTLNGAAFRLRGSGSFL